VKYPCYVFLPEKDILSRRNFVQENEQSHENLKIKITNRYLLDKYLRYFITSYSERFPQDLSSLLLRTPFIS
jgi:hypothetical protein